MYDFFISIYIGILTKLDIYTKKNDYNYFAEIVVGYLDLSNYIII